MADNLKMPREQLEWAINYLEANYQANFADNTEHGSIDWM
eukprot:SAG22_NODE_18854_length_280_cov_1.381215_1_plen_39_part_01